MEVGFHAKFCRNQLSSFEDVTGRKLPFPTCITAQAMIMRSHLYFIFFKTFVLSVDVINGSLHYDEVVQQRKGM